jgi:hypothetical protein
MRKLGLPLFSTKRHAYESTRNELQDLEGVRKLEAGMVGYPLGGRRSCGGR